MSASIEREADDSSLSDSPTAVPLKVNRDTMRSLASIPLSKDTETVMLPTSSLTE